MPLLSAVQKLNVRKHLGYLNVQEAYTFVLGRPQPVLSQFLVEGAMDRLLSEAVPECLRLISILDGIEAQMVGDQELLAVLQIGEIQINPDEWKGLIRQYQHWQGALGNLFGVAPYPYDQRFGGAMGQWGIGVRIMHI